MPGDAKFLVLAGSLAVAQFFAWLDVRRERGVPEEPFLGEGLSIRRQRAMRIHEGNPMLEVVLDCRHEFNGRTLRLSCNTSLSSGGSWASAHCGDEALAFPDLIRPADSEHPQTLLFEVRQWGGRAVKVMFLRVAAVPTTMDDGKSLAVTRVEWQRTPQTC